MKKKTASQLEIKNLHVRVIDQHTNEHTAILHGVDLMVRPGEVHAIMGPNGSGKSTLAYTLAGHPFYQVESGEISLNGENILEKSPDERSAAGLFLAFQYPVEVPGVKIQNFLRAAYNARFAHEPEKLFPSVLTFRQHVEKLADELKVKKELLSRGLNEGFSGGEKKRVEILQMATLEPSFAILDETDSGLDVDAMRAVASGVKKIIEKYNTGVIVITHYQRILKYLQPDFVHVMKAGKIIQSGDKKLAAELEKKGYERI